jgi:histidinol dehydrogenase
MRIIPSTDAEAVEELVNGIERSRVRAVAVVSRIVDDVRTRGDKAVRDWSARLDGYAGPFAMTPRTLKRGWARTPHNVRAAIRLAVRNVGRVSAAQRPRRRTVDVVAGVRVELQPVPLDRVGCYVPGGRFPLVSTLIMTAVPARVAGVGEVIVACPAVTPAICCAALEAGATRVLRIGGAQAIAALAYGTRTIARVDKIVGPGNRYVAAAKRLVSDACAVDFEAGPSEIAIWSDAGAPAWMAADLIAQAEHDPDARAILVTSRRALAARVVVEVNRQLDAHPHARAAIERQGAVVVTRSRRDSADLINRLAAEHVVCDTRADAALVRHAGTVFVGRWSAQAAGDYTTGSNHVLPTGGAARARGGLSTLDLMRIRTVQTVTPRGLARIGPAAIALAEAEGLSAHAASIARRLQERRPQRRGGART